MTKRTKQDPLPRRDDRDPVAVTRRVYPLLLNLANFIGCGDSAEDWVQEALIETLRRHPNYRGLSNPEGYARTVLLRLVARGRLRTRRRIARELETASLIVEYDSPPDIEARLTGSELLSRLPLRQRACVYLRVICDLSDQQAAAVLGCRTSTIRSNVARGLASLQRDPAFSSTLEAREHAKRTFV